MCKKEGTVQLKMKATEYTEGTDDYIVNRK